MLSELAVYTVTCDPSLSRYITCYFGVDPEVFRLLVILLGTFHNPVCAVVDVTHDVACNNYRL